MPRKGTRTTITRGVYRDGSGFSIRRTVGGIVYETRMPLDSTLKELQRTRAELESRGRTASPSAPRGSLREAIPAFLRAKAHLATVDDLEDDLNAWEARLGATSRHRISPTQILTARASWLAQGLSPKTINDRVGTLRNFLRLIDGKHTASIFDDIDPLPVPRSVIQRVSNELILAVDLKLQEHEQDGRHSVLNNGKTRARFRVMVSTGRRPSEIMRTQPQDVNLDARVWVPRDGKGGHTPGIYLNEDMLAAWTCFVEANAWGAFNLGSFGRTIRAAGWPKDVRPYQARHSYGITLSEAGVDLADVGTLLGHRPGSRMTRHHYVPVLGSRIQKASEAVDGRFQGWNVKPEREPSRKRKRK